MLNPNKIRTIAILTAVLIVGAALTATAGVKDVPIGILFSHEAPTRSRSTSPDPSTAGAPTRTP